MIWGDLEWGAFEWGDGPTIVETTLDRLLQFIRLGPNLRAHTQLFATRTLAMLEVLGQIGRGFDLTTGVGDQLDRIGQVLQLPRYGASDERYRVLLRIQALLVLSSAANATTLIEIVREFTGADPFEVNTFHPMTFELGAIVPPADAPLLASMIRKAKAACYTGHVVTSASGPLFADTDDEDVSGPGNVDTHNGAADEAFPVAVIWD
jgi:hypothetical protein